MVTGSEVLKIDALDTFIKVLAITLKIAILFYFTPRSSFRIKNLIVLFGKRIKVYCVCGKIGRYRSRSEVYRLRAQCIISILCKFRIIVSTRSVYGTHTVTTLVDDLDILSVTYR